MRKLVLVLKVLALGLTLSSASSVMASDNQQKLVLKGVTYDSVGMLIQVASGGCTTRDSLAVHLTQKDGEPTQIEFSRRVPDFCEGYFPNGVRFYYTFRELGVEGQNFLLGNAIDPGTIYSGTLAPRED